MLTWPIVWAIDRRIEMPGLFLLVALVGDVGIIYIVAQALRGCV